MGSQKFLLSVLLRDVSRSFYLTIRVLPLPFRLPIGTAYLLARAADTIADTALIDSRLRQQLLSDFRKVIQGELAIGEYCDCVKKLVCQQDQHAEALLLFNLSKVFSLYQALDENDRRYVRQVLLILTEGMLFDLAHFPNEQSGEIVALTTPEQLKKYTYWVAGCVGEFWSNICYAHDKRLGGWDIDQQCQLGIRFGQALQLTNILRDMEGDFAIGRCYLPEKQFAQFGVNVVNEWELAKFKQLRLHWLSEAVEHYQSAIEYILRVPRQAYLLRLSVLWPVVIGLETLSLLAQQLISNEIIERPIKISRQKVYALVAKSLYIAPSNALTNQWLGKLSNRVRAQLSYNSIY